MVVSQKHIAVIDPHRKCIKPKSETSPAGIKKKLSNFFQFRGHVSTFESIFDLNTKEKNYCGTIFRFPLRKPRSYSEISDKVYTPEMVREKLFESLKEESPYILLFLRNVKSISLMEWTKDSTQPHQTFQVTAAINEKVDNDTIEVEGEVPRCEVFAKQCSQSSETDDSEVYLELKSTTVTVTSNDNISCHHWLVLKVVGTNDHELNDLGKELSILPWVGLASRLPGQIALTNCETTTTSPFDDCTTVETVFEQLRSSLVKSQQSMKWSGESVETSPGHAYCFLPLPECTAMPVHVHGYFAVTDNRRSIKWPAHDEKGKEAQWNRQLLQKMVAPAYALLLTSRASLIHYEDTPLLITNTENMTDPYSTWPLYPEVKNVPIWNELLSPTLDLALPLPLLWTSACGGKWVQFHEAYFLPGSCGANTYACSEVVQLLISLNISVVSLPRSVCETLKQNESMKTALSKNEITPHFVRSTVGQNPHSCSSLSKTQVYDILAFILSDLDIDKSADLIGIPLLPLKRASDIDVFEVPTGTNNKYIFLSMSKHLLDIVPGADKLIVDPELPETTAEKLCDITSSSSRYLQLKKVDNKAMCSELLHKSIFSWCTEKRGVGWKWLPGESSMPPQSWLDALWKWIAEEKVQLSSLEGLPIIPQLADDVNHEGGVTLIQVSKTTKMCRFSSLFTTRQRKILLSVMKKFGFIIVDESKMKSCDGIKDHPDFEDFIPEISLRSDLIIKFLNGMNRISRIQMVQKLDNDEKDLLRELSSNLEEQCIKTYQSCLRSIPVYHAAAGNERSPCYISLGEIDGSDEAFLLPDNIPTLPKYPKSLISATTSHEEVDLLKTLAVKQLCLFDLCASHLIPLALEIIRLSSQSWSVGDDLVVWILKQQHQVPSETFDSLSCNKIILTLNSTRKEPQEVYDPQDSTFTLLFDVDTDKDYFPITNYFEDTHCRPALLTIGMMTWPKIQDDYNKMHNLLCDRMKSMSNLDRNTQMIRGQFILQTLAEPNNIRLQQNTSLNSVPFLKAQTCPHSYPSGLREKWFGQVNRLYSIEELFSPDDNSHSLIGTVLPIVSQDYCIGTHAVPMNAFNKLAFRKVSDLDSSILLRQLANLKSVVSSITDTAKFDQIVMSVYDYLSTSSCQKKLNVIWWRDSQTFLPANQFVLDLPESLQFNLEPFYYHLRVPLRKYAQHFQLHDPLSPADAAQVVEEMKRQTKGKLTSQQVSLCVSILIWLYDKEYEGSNVLMPTEECLLIPPMECVFDDREWMKHSNSKEHIMSKSLTFVHDQIPQKVAKYFKVASLSSKVAPSRQLRIAYTRAGQHEDITQRIRHIVQDYETNIDIFKELIQNADDAGASEVKFLIDWRHHPTDTLFSKDLEVWQGPALIVYNNATFSDEDFENICLVAGETKKKDPLKTGRFGVGFCATYHLTDLPSFISRKKFTMFDPHTSYLGERITAQSPGMRIEDIVKDQADLKFYEDQFKPYDSLFGCNVFKLSGDGFPGTLFRFPFRCQHTSRESKICKNIYDREMVSTLVQALKEQSNELLLFLKHITKVTVYELESNRLPSDAKVVFSVQRSGSSGERIQLIRTASSPQFSEERTCSTQFQIEVNDVNKRHSQTWLVSSALRPLSSEIQSKPEAKGLLHLAEVALQIDLSKENLTILPNSDSNPSKVFCFLPLPIKCRLPFHVNGFFSIGKDRRNVTATDDKTFGSMWNKTLAEGALVTAFVHELECLRNECDRKLASNPELKAKFLCKYYSLWNMGSASGLIDASFVAAFKQCVPELTCQLLWSEVNGGCWLPPTSVCVFEDSILRQKKTEMGCKSVKQVIEEDAISLLLKRGYGIVDVPRYIYNILKKGLKSSSREFDYKRVCEEFLFPNIRQIDSKVRDRNIKFLIERFGAYHGNDNWYDWAQPFLNKSPCIRCQNSDTLLPACKLIDPTNKHFSELFDVNEGRFPCKELQESSLVMQGLRRLGMSSSRLSVDDLKGRALSVIELTEYDAALKRSVSLCEYIDTAYSYIRVSSDKEELKHLSDIRFLPVKPKPDDIDLPWNGKSKCFDSPSRMYLSEKENLLFTQYPLVEAKLFSERSMRLLGVSLKETSVEVVIANLKCIVDHVKHITNELNEATIKFLDDCMRDIYSNLCVHRSTPSVITMLKQLNTFIWQYGCFLSPSQVVGGYWGQSCVPYLSDLSSSNIIYSELMYMAGVKHEVTIEMLVEVLKKVATDHRRDDNTLSPISDKVLDFVIYTSRKLGEKLSITSDESYHSLEMYLPDENLFMRNASDLADNISFEWVKSLPAYRDFVAGGKGFYVHKLIPRECAVALGVKPLLEAVLKEIEDTEFLSGTDFGQHEDLCDRLNGILKKYPADESIFKEFIQNADDAQATEIIFVLDRRKNFPDNSLLSPRSEWKSLQRTPALCIYNNRKFTEEDIKGITKLGRGGKDQSVDLIGKFGIGFNVAYHVTDCPSFVSYSDNETPEHLCVFDPTQSFVANKHSRGRKWDFKNRDDYSGLSDQFKPYLLDDLPRLSNLVSSCLKDTGNYGHVVFRLPLTRYDRPSVQTKAPVPSYVSILPNKVKPSLSAGKTFSPYGIYSLFQKFSSISQNVLLFLNHLKIISAFEIKNDGSLAHHFTTTVSIPSPYLEDCRRFSQSLKQFAKAKQGMARVSITHKVDVTHIQPNSDPQQEEWLIQRVIGGEEFPNELVKAGLSQGLRPVGGVATLLKPPTADHKYLLFCFLPLPIQSDLPVHVNGHFLVDDSRKHLETIEHFGLSKWNDTLAHKLIVPAYVDLIVAVKEFIDIKKSGEVKFYYSLFPREATQSESDTIEDNGRKKKVGELNDLKIVRTFYSELIQRNPCVFVREVPEDGSANPSWMNVKSSLFCVPYHYQTKGSLTCQPIKPELHKALVVLGLLITNAPNCIYDECVKADNTFSQMAAVEPAKINQHLRSLVCTTEQREVISKNIVDILEFCIAGYDSREIQGLFNFSLYLLAQDGSLQQGYLFDSTFSILLPHCSNKFVNKSLETSHIAEQLIRCNVIRPLPIEFVSDNVKLVTTKSGCPIGECSTDTIHLLWKYFIYCSEMFPRISTVTSLLNRSFSNKAIIPASDGNLYPVCLSKMLVRDSIGSCDNCCVMKKLGYPSIDFQKIQMSLSSENQLLTNIINDLTSCFQAGEDIIHCFKLRSPQTANIKLDDEVLSFIASLGKAPVSHLQSVSRYLLEMPLFYTIDRSTITLQGVRKVFILTTTDIPLDGIPASHNGQVVLRRGSSEAMENFYNGVIPQAILTYVNAEEAYLQLILPILTKLPQTGIKAHVDYLFVKRDQMKHAFDRLKETPFIQHDEQFYKASDLCDPNKEFYKTFKPDNILPSSWHDKVDVLKNLGLQSEVSHTEWLQWAKMFAQEVTSRDANCKYKSNVLLNQLIEILHNRHYDRTFLPKVADIKFLYSPQEWELNAILSSVFPGHVSKIKHHHRYMVKFRGSVSLHEANLACLCKPILPENCQQLTVIYKHELSVELPASSATVAENLKCLCQTISASCARSHLSPQNIDRLIKIFDAHYAALSKKRPPQQVLNELKDMMCILPSKSQLLQLVKPSQLVMQLPLDCLLEPYCFKVETWLQKHVDFLTAVGVKEELKAQDYIDILRSIKMENKDENNIHSKDTKVIGCAYKALISRLRCGDCIDAGVVLYLPDESFQLTIATELCLNDVPWYKTRLPTDCVFKMILPPPNDNKGQPSLPNILKIKRLSEIVTEELKESCKSSDFTCNEEELFKIGKRPERGRCEFVKNILETLKSDELSHGFYRMYFTEYKTPPTESFKILVQRLKQVQVHCLIGELKTVLSINGQLLPGSENKKLCHLSRENDTFILYISPHSKTLANGDLSPFFKELAFSIGKLMDNEIRNQGPIAAVFGCYPNEIPQTLTREQIQEYSEDDHQVIKAVIIGSEVPWSEFPAQEALVILNFDDEDPVHYINENGTLINAEVVKGCQVGLLEKKIIIKFKETEEDDEEKVSVSPLRVFKVLTASQKKSLWSGTSSPYASPVALATLPAHAEDHTELDRLLIQIRKDFQSSQFGLVQSIQALRLICHLHYQLVVQKGDQTLFNRAVIELRDKLCNAGKYDNAKARRVLNLIATTVEKLTSQRVSEATFPSKMLRQIVESDEFPLPHAPSTGITTTYIPFQIQASYPTTTTSSRFSTPRRAQSRRGHQYPRFAAAMQAVPEQRQPPPPNISLPSATAWMEQAKADFNAAETLLGSHALQPVETASAVGENQCRFPALVCFLCHDTVEKCIKGVYYAFCGLRQDLISCSNLTSLHEILKTMPHHPPHLLKPIEECVMTVNRHETRSRFPIYQHPPCAPATIYSLEDAQESFQATSQLLHVLQAEENLNPILQDLGQLPSRRFRSCLQSMSGNQGMLDNTLHFFAQ